ncbi:hypothetical protein GQ53DRAFT_758345 [Thozetella sp. PMI_491]|nr:hypothetical protein GQ53DRAFT_758345 [Thozetella sp. PMI_491]
MSSSPQNRRRLPDIEVQAAPERILRQSSEFRSRLQSGCSDEHEAPEQALLESIECFQLNLPGPDPSVSTLGSRGPAAAEPAGGVGTAFTLFPSLPAELRLAIWEHALGHRRYRRVRLYGTLGSHAVRTRAQMEFRLEGQRGVTRGPRLTGPEPYTQRNALGNIISGQLYRAMTSAPSVLLQVSQEAREAVLGVYYLALPTCGTEDLDRWGADDGAESRSQEESPPRVPQPVVRISPEWDFVQIENDRGEQTDVLDGLHDLRAYDPRGIGVRNWIVAKNVVHSLPLVFFPRLDPYADSLVKHAGRETVLDLLSPPRIAILHADFNIPRYGSSDYAPVFLRRASGFDGPSPLERMAVFDSEARIAHPRTLWGPDPEPPEDFWTLADPGAERLRPTAFTI